MYRFRFAGRCYAFRFSGYIVRGKRLFQRLVGHSLFSASQDVIGYYLASPCVRSNASEGLAVFSETVLLTLVLSPQGRHRPTSKYILHQVIRNPLARAIEGLHTACKHELRRKKNYLTAEAFLGKKQKKVEVRFRLLLLRSDTELHILIREPEKKKSVLLRSPMMQNPTGQNLIGESDGPSRQILGQNLTNWRIGFSNREMASVSHQVKIKLTRAWHSSCTRYTHKYE